MANGAYSAEPSFTDTNELHVTQIQISKPEDERLQEGKKINFEEAAACKEEMNESGAPTFDGEVLCADVVL